MKPTSDNGGSASATKGKTTLHSITEISTSLRAGLQSRADARLSRGTRRPTAFLSSLPNLIPVGRHLSVVEVILGVRRRLICVDAVDMVVLLSYSFIGRNLAPPTVGSSSLIHRCRLARTWTGGLSSCATASLSPKQTSSRCANTPRIFSSKKATSNTYTRQSPYVLATLSCRAV